MDFKYTFFSSSVLRTVIGFALGFYTVAQHTVCTGTANGT